MDVYRQGAVSEVVATQAEEDTAELIEENAARDSERAEESGLSNAVELLQNVGVAAGSEPGEESVADAGAERDEDVIMAE
jgi:hypothetical protein